MEDRLDFLLEEFNDSQARLNELRDFLETHSENPTAVSYLLSGVINTAREQGKLLVNLGTFGINSIEDAVVAYTRQKTNREE